MDANEATAQKGGGRPECVGACAHTEAVDCLFGLSYADYFVAPRTVLQSMPPVWQQAFARLVEEYERAAHAVPIPTTFYVRAAREVEIWELSEAERVRCLDGRVSVEGEDSDEPVYYLDGREVDAYLRVLLPDANPIPNYNRGRTRLVLQSHELDHPGHTFRDWSEVSEHAVKVIADMFSGDRTLAEHNAHAVLARLADQGITVERLDKEA